MTEPPSKWFTVPSPVRKLFKLFPLRTYPPNELPERSPPTIRDLPALYVFSDEKDALRGLPSFNPLCLKWQVFLRMAGVEVQLLHSNNHASPSGVLPFLLPAGQTQEPLGASKLREFARENGTVKVDEVEDIRLEAYQAMLDYRIRNIWLYAIYLSPENDTILSRLYLSHTSSPLVRRALLHQLRAAAENEILKSTAGTLISPDVLYEEAHAAFSALSILLGAEDHWFFSSSGPTLFDAAVFAYTRLIVDGELGWKDRRLVEMVQEFPNLVRHESQIYQKYFEEYGPVR